MSALERFGANAAEKLAPMRRIAVLGAPINMGAWQRGTMMGRRRAHLIMELLHDTGLVGSVDIVELNPLLDERGRTARTAVELIGSLFSQQIRIEAAQASDATC